MNIVEESAVNEKASSAASPPAGWRLKLGVAMFVLSIVVPVAGIPLVAILGLSVAITATVSSVLVGGSEALGLLAVAVMGKPGYLYIRGRVLAILRRYGPPKEVSRARYNTGLVMFGFPILFGWVTPYLAHLIPSLEDSLLAYAISGDILLLASLFVLGGNFWDKIHALFFHDAEVRFAQR